MVWTSVNIKIFGQLWISIQALTCLLSAYVQGAVQHDALTTRPQTDLTCLIKALIHNSTQFGHLGAQSTAIYTQRLHRVNISHHTTCSSLKSGHNAGVQMDPTQITKGTLEFEFDHIMNRIAIINPQLNYKEANICSRTVPDMYFFLVFRRLLCLIM